MTPLLQDAASCVLDDNKGRATGQQAEASLGREALRSSTHAAIFQIAEHCNREQFRELIGPIRGSSSLTAGTATSTWTPSDRCAGLTSSATFAATQKA
jgi:hypothetical protein